MDLCAVGIKSTQILRNWVPDRSISGNFKVFDIGGLSRKGGCGGGPRSLVVKAMAKKNHGNSDNSDYCSGNGDPSIPEGDDTKGKNSPSEKHKSSLKVDWREFRAALFAREQTETVTHGEGDTHLESKPLGPKWAHPLSTPETGCVLLATEKLDGEPTFKRTVVLLLRSGTHHPQEGPFGVVINRPLHKRIKHMNPSNVDLATTFSECSLYYGGPLEASMFLLKTGVKGFDEVVPGLSFGARNSLDEAAGLAKKGVVRAQDFKFFVGYAGWQLDQLKEEIDSGYWHVAACSANLIFSAYTKGSSEGLWEEILQLMGGHYSELGRKPKQDS